MHRMHTHAQSIKYKFDYINIKYYNTKWTMMSIHKKKRIYKYKLHYTVYVVCRVYAVGH